MRLLVQVLGHERIGGEQEVCREQVAHHVRDAGRGVADVVAHPFQRSSVPGVQVLLRWSLGKFRREGRIVDQEAGRGERAVVRRGTGAHEPHRPRSRELAHHRWIFPFARQHPHMGEVREFRLRDEGPENSLRVAEHAVAGE